MNPAANSSERSRPRAAVLRIGVLVLRVGLAALLIIAGALKLKDPSGFATEIANYQLATFLAPYLAAALPVTEVLIGVTLLAPRRTWRSAAAAAALMLLGLFSVAVTSAYLRGIDIACGCFGGGGTAITWLTLARNAGLLAAGAVVLVFDRPEKPAAPTTSRA